MYIFHFLIFHTKLLYNKAALLYSVNSRYLLGRENSPSPESVNPQKK